MKLNICQIYPKALKINGLIGVFIGREVHEDGKSLARCAGNGKENA